jgi:hypothetical protein
MMSEDDDLERLNRRRSTSEFYLNPAAMPRARTSQSPFFWECNVSGNARYIRRSSHRWQFKFPASSADERIEFIANSNDGKKSNIS